jgi:hypothetical protein
MRYVVSLVLMLSSAGVQAQTSAWKPGPVPVRDEPYVAERVTTHTQVLANGTKIEKTTSTKEMRDSRGRTWSRWQIAQDPLHPTPERVMTGFYDPDTRTRMDWCSCNSIVRVTHFAEPRPLPAEKTPGPEGMDVYLGPGPDNRLKYHGEDLPPQTLQGVWTRGSKVVRTLPAGKDGNDHELTTTVLSWYSPELHLAMMTIIDDPVKGLTKLEFVNLRRVEPDPALYVVPAGYMFRDQN